MRLVYYDYNIEIDFSYGKITNVVIENPLVLYGFIMGLWHTINKHEEKISVFDNFEKMDFTKITDLIFSPLELTYRKKDIQKRMIEGMLEEITESDLSFKFSEAYAALLEIVKQVKMNCEYEIDFDENLELKKLIKCFDIHLQEPSGNFLKRLIEYISVTAKLMNNKIFFLLGGFNFINDGEYNLLEKHAAYEDVAIINIEGKQNNLKSLENQYIMDVDLCEI